MYKIQDLRSYKTKKLEDIKKGEVVEIEGDVYIAIKKFGDETLYFFDIKNAQLWEAVEVCGFCNPLVKLTNIEITIIDEKEL